MVAKPGADVGKTRGMNDRNAQLIHPIKVCYLPDIGVVTRNPAHFRAAVGKVLSTLERMCALFLYHCAHPFRKQKLLSVASLGRISVADPTPFTSSWLALISGPLCPTIQSPYYPADLCHPLGFQVELLSNYLVAEQLRSNRGDLGQPAVGTTKDFSPERLPRAFAFSFLLRLYGSSFPDLSVEGQPTPHWRPPHTPKYRYSILQLSYSIQPSI